MVEKAIFKTGAKFGRWESNLKNPAPTLKQIGALMVSESQAAFKAQQFGKDKWAERAVPNVYGIISDFHLGKSAPEARRFEATPALVDTGALKGPRGVVFSVSGKTLTVGSKLDYASTHQFGGKIESMKITSEVLTLLYKWLKKQGKDMKRELGWLFNKKFRDKTLVGKVEARPFIGITKQTIDDVQEVLGVSIMEVK